MQVFIYICDHLSCLSFLTEKNCQKFWDIIQQKIIMNVFTNILNYGDLLDIKLIVCVTN